MKRILIFVLVLFFAVDGKSQSQISKYVTVDGIGWKRVAYSSNNVGRGYNKVTLMTKGGNRSPYVTELTWFKGWSNYGGINVISTSSSGYWTDCRITFDGVKSYLEVYFERDVSSLFVALDQTEWSGADIIGGTLPRGGGTVISSAKIGRLNLGENDLVLSYSGNLGINESNPIDKLVVNQSSNEYWATLIKNSGGSGKGLLVRSGAASNIPVFQIEDNYQHIRFIVKSNGEVGIGRSDTNGNLLAVAGNTAIDGILKAKEINVQANVWADFVFEEDYKLRPLDEVEAFVKINKHLPEIPSAKQMEAEGVNVAEMNKLLLQKVEELTLYTIQLQKDNNHLFEKQNQQEQLLISQQDEIEAQKSKISSLESIEQRLKIIENTLIQK